MAREIKFRAWDKENKKMWFPKAVTSDGSNTALVMELGVLCRDLQEDNLMQFTGLKDKNGKDIYEGDIIRMFGASSHVIEYVESRATFEPMSIDDGRYSSVFKGIDVEVIGNIHENPELLNENPSTDNH